MIMIVVGVIGWLVATVQAVQMAPFSTTLYPPVSMYRSRQLLIKVPILQVCLALAIPLASATHPLI